MPAGANVSTVVGVAVNTTYATLTAAEAAARATRDAAWDALSPLDPISSMQAAFTTYQNTFATAMRNAQSTLGTAIAQTQSFFQAAFDAFNTALSGGGTVADGLTQAGRMDRALDGAMNNGGQVQQVVEQGTETAVFMMSVQLADIQSANGFEFNGAQLTFADEVVLQHEGASYALASIKYVDRFESVPAVAGLGNEGPLKNLQYGARARVMADFGKGIPVMCGTLVGIAEDLDADGATLRIIDDKYHLEGVHIRGGFVYVPGEDDEEGQVYFDHAHECEFNPNGRPNCIDSPEGPLFAPVPDFNLVAGLPISNETSMERARYWTRADVAQYLRFACFSDFCKTYVSSLPSYMTLSADRVYWPGGAGSALLSDGVITDNDRAAVAGIKDGDVVRGAEAIMPGRSYKGWDLHSALKDLASTAGAYALYMAPRTDGRSAIVFVPTRYRPQFDSAAKRAVIRQVGTSWGSENKPKVAHGSIQGDASQSFSSAAVDGDIVWLEMRFEYDPDDADSGLQASWSAEELQAVRDYIADTQGVISYDKTRQAYEDAVGFFPHVLCGFQINTDLEWQANTKYSNHPRVPTPPRVLSHLLTYWREVGTGSRKRRIPLPVLVEVKIDSDGDGDFDTWRVAQKGDGFEMDEQGIIYFPGLRDLALTSQDLGLWVGTYTDPNGDLDSLNQMRPRPIRITIPIALNTRINAAAALNLGEWLQAVTDVNKTVVTADPNGDGAEFVDRFQRQYYVDVGDGYREYLRKDAYPIPQSVPNNVKFTALGELSNYLLGSTGRDDKCTLGNELLSERAEILTHAKARLADKGRIQRTSHLVFECFNMLTPGTTISTLKTQGSRSATKKLNGIVSRWRASYKEQICEIDAM